MPELLSREEVRRLLEHLGFVEVESWGDWRRYRLGRVGVQSLVMDMSQANYYYDDVSEDLGRVGVHKDDVDAAYLFMRSVDY